jgi:CDP-diacylglycerol--glycerol-3-phosphate 3-phosphatidyltransferase
VAFWLKQMHRLATPLARRRISPDLVSISGVLLTAGAAASAWSPLPGRLIWSALLIGLAGLADGLDGAVAVLQRRDGARGAVVDAVCDRIADLLLVLALWLAGAPAGVCIALAAVFLMHEYVRALARGVGMRDGTVITVGERPTRVIVVAAFLLAGGMAGGSTEDLLDVADVWPVAGAWCALVLGAIGIGQLALWLRRTLT